MILSSSLLTFVLVSVAWQQELVTGHVHFKKGAPHVELPNGGLISGEVKFSRDGRPYTSFKGIPYATVPERFQEPQLITVPTWQGILSATKPGSICPQMMVAPSVDTHTNAPTEDCLNLNVYVPMNNTGTGKRGYPVMVWLHGGGFMFSSGYGYGPQYFMDEDVIVVTINYRLGVFGFLSTEDSVIPGNNGLKDMVVALKWVQQNIKSFGGDPSKVTIFGESAGGAAVHYLLLSPTTKGLFHRAISQSGSALGLWAHNLNPRETAVELATYLKCATTATDVSKITSEEVLNCLRALSTDELSRAQGSFKPNWPLNLRPFYFAPTTEPNEPVSSLTPFLSESPISILTRKDRQLQEIPWMVGATEDEGAGMFAGIVLSNPETVTEFYSDWNTIAPSVFDYGKYIPADQQAKMSQELKQFYFGNKEISEETRVELTNIFSDQMILHGVYRAALETASRGKRNAVYLYQYAYQGPVSVVGKMLPINLGKGEQMVGHGDELQHLFDVSGVFPGTEGAVRPDTPDEEFSKNLVRLWTTFAIHGEPRHSWGNATRWKPVSKKQLDGLVPLNWYRIQANPSLPEIDQSIKDRMQLWDDLWSEYLIPAIEAKHQHLTTPKVQETAGKGKSEL